MPHRLFVVAALLSACTGGASAHDQPEQVLAFAGGDVVLPCSFNISVVSEFPTVEWSKEGLKPDVVFLYRDGSETFEMKNPAFDYRTSLIMRELKDGNLSLRISNVQLSDAGTYHCRRFLKNAVRMVTSVELLVVAAAEPKLSLSSAGGGGLALHCEAGCWLPEPRITFLDDKGKFIDAENPEKDLDPRGCFTVTRRVALTRATSSVTCRVQQPEFNQTRETTFLIPDDCLKPEVRTIGIAIGGTALFFLAAAGFISLLCKKCCKLALVKQPESLRSSDQSLTSELDLIQTRGSSPDGLVHGGTGQPKRKPELHMEDETLCKLLKDKVTHHIRPTIVRSNSTSTPAAAHPSQRKHSVLSSPDIVPIYAASSKSSLSDSSLLKIDSTASPHPKFLLRRHSLVLPQLADFNNQYSILGSLTEGPIG